MTNSRRKGADFERLIAKRLREAAGWTERECYRGAPMQASGVPLLPDVVTPSFWWVECKRLAKMTPAILRRAFEQASADAPPLLHDIVTPTPVVVWQEDRGRVCVTMRAKDAADIIGPHALVTVTEEDWLRAVSEWTE